MTAVIGRHLEPYGTQVYLAWTPADWAKVRKIVPGGLEAWSRADGIATTYDERRKGEHHVAIRIDYKTCPGEAELAGIAAHEALHAAMSVCDRAGIQVNAYNDEAAAYLAQWFAHLIWINRPFDKPWEKAS